MPTCALTDVAIRALAAPSSGQATYWDAGQAGFGVRVSPGGTKTFVVMHGVERRRLTIGRFPTITLKQAREEARRLQASLTLGLLTKRPSLPFADALELFIEASAQKNRARTVDDYRRLLTRHFAFRRKRLAEINRADIQAKLNRLKETPSEQRHAFVAAKVFFNWAAREEHVETSPIATLRAPTSPKSRERVLTPDEFAEILRKAASHPWPFGPVVQLLALTGQRRGEIAALRWSWIDREKQLITMPSGFTKNRRLHVLPYGERVAILLASLPEQGEYVFPGRTENASHFNGWGKCKRQFDAELNGVSSYVLHDLRRTFSSTMAELGTPIHVTEKLLNHVSGTIQGVAAIYNRHSYMNEMRAAIGKFDEHIGRLLDR